MYVGKDFDAADPLESEVYTFDFVKDLPTGETIASAVWTCTVAADSDADDAAASSRLSGSPTVIGKKTSHRLLGLVAGVKYLLQAVATTNTGNVIALHSHVTSIEAA